MEKRKRNIKNKWIIFIPSIILALAIILEGVVLFKLYNLKAHSKSTVVLEEVFVFPKPTSLIEIEVNTNGAKLPNTKKEGSLPVTMKITVDDETIEKPGTITVQGSSTEKWPKKNWTIKLYNDEERTKVLKIQIGDSIISDQWIAKADWIDPTMLRNGVSYSLWESMVKSRTSSPKYEVENALLVNSSFEGIKGAQGFPKAYVGRIKINDEYYGITTLLLGHDPDNFNIDKENSKNMYLEFDARFGYTDVKTWGKFKSEGIGEWIDGYFPKNEDMTEEQKKSIDNLGKLINGSLEDFKKDFDKYLDKANIIDMLLFLEAVGDWDAVAQDIEMVTYDLEKWYMLPWDKDTTFGMDWDESGLQKNSEKTLLIDYKKEDPTQKPWYKTYHAFTAEVEERYAELRNNNVFTVNNLEKLINDINSKISEEVWEEEMNKWNPEGRPSLEETSSEQILSWFKIKLETLDKQFNYKP